MPLVGKPIAALARSGENVTGDTLARFYALHVVILPLATLALLGIHLFLVQKHGMSVPPNVAREHGGAEKLRTMPFIPHFLLRDMVGWYVALGILAALAALFPWELGQKADPFGSAPEGIKPEWYFLFMFQTLKQLPAHLFGIEWLEGEVVGVLFFGLWPGRGAGPAARSAAAEGGPRPVLNFLAAWAVFAFVVQTAAGLDLLAIESLGIVDLQWVGDRGILAYLAYRGPTARVGPPGKVAMKALRGILLAILAAALGAGAATGQTPEQKTASGPSRAATGAAELRARSAHASAGDDCSEKPAGERSLSPSCPSAATERRSARAKGRKTPTLKAAEKPAEQTAAKPGENQPRPNRCVDCHSTPDIWVGDQLKFYVTEKDFGNDIHWAKGLRCPDCHGGDPTTIDSVTAAHAGFRPVKTRADVVRLCGNCHANIEYMRRFNPSPRTRPIGANTGPAVTASGWKTRMTKGGHLRLLPRQAARIGIGPGQARHPRRGRPGVAGLSHQRGQDLRPVPRRRRS